PCGQPCRRNARAHDRSPFFASADQRRSPGKGEGNRCGGAIHPERRQCLRRASVCLRRVEGLPAAPFLLEDNAPVRRYACPNLVVARLSAYGLKRLAARCPGAQALPLPEIKTFVRTMGTARRGKRNASSRFRDAIAITRSALNRNRFSRLIDRDQRKDAMCDAKFFARHVTRHPNVDGNGH